MGSGAFFKKNEAGLIFLKIVLVIPAAARRGNY
jgi:hypothetical protein